jgi:excisionase family DNA binding protein
MTDRPMTSADGGTYELHQFMTVTEIAAMMRVSRATVYRLLHAGHLPRIRVGRSLRVSRHAVETYMRISTVHSPGTRLGPGIAPRARWAESVGVRCAGQTRHSVRPALTVNHP